MRLIPADALDYVCVPSRLSTSSYFSLSLTSLSPLSHLSLTSLSPLSLTPANSSCVRFSFSVLFPLFLDFRVQYQCLSFPCFQFIALAFIPQRSHSMFPILIPCRF